MSTVISMTTIPDRIAHIGPCVESLLAQGLPVHVWAVEKIERSDTRLKEVPGWLAESGAIVQIVEDRGPITKLLPALECGFDTILVADDDRTYGRHWASGLLAWAEQLPGAALGYGGRIINSLDYGKCTKVQCGKLGQPVRIDVLMGAYGILFQRESFDAGIFEEWRRWPTNDDLVVAAHLQRRGVARYVVPGHPGIRAIGEVNRIKPLWALNKGRNARHRRNNEGLRVLRLCRGV